MNQVMVDWTVIAHLVLTEIRDFCSADFVTINWNVMVLFSYYVLF